MKDEERTIKRCLACISKLADEIIVVDTGSQDGSKELAWEFPKVRLFNSEFFDKDTPLADFEFGKARNEAIKRCTGDWVAWFDADDLIDDENLAKIREIAEKEKRDCLFSFWVKSGPLRIEHCRMFRNGKGILFDENHACHEFLNGLGHLPIYRHDILIQHLPEQKKISSIERNLAIMEKDYFVRKRDDPRTLFYLANTYKDIGRLDEAIAFYDKYLAVASHSREERFFARFYKGQCLFRLEKFDEGREEALRALSEDYRFAESWCLLGDAEMVKSNWERAILFYKLAMATPFPDDAQLFTAEAPYSQYPTRRIGECLARLGVKELPDGSASAKFKKELFELPADRSLAMLAAAALSNIVTAGKANVDIVPLDEWQLEMVKSFAPLGLAQGRGKKLSLPLNLKGQPAQEWYARSAGYLDIIQAPVRIVSTKQPIREKRLVLVTPEVGLPPVILEKIQQAGKTMKVLDPNCGFREAELVFQEAVAYIGTIGWFQHLAEWHRLPAFVFFDGRSHKEFGWDNQENRSEGDFTGLENFLDRSLR
jgi:glycosyltransferase involved in cell wall biosynthesis